MKTEIYTTYAEKADMTFIMCDTFDKVGEVVSVECIGWYFGKPDETATKMYKGKLKAEF